MPPTTTEVNSIDVFVNLVTEELLRVPKYVHMRSRNLSREEMLSLNNLEKDQSITIKPSDKGGNIVVMDTSEYRSLCMSLLGDASGYEVLPQNPSNTIMNELRSMVNEGFKMGVIDKNEKEFLTPLHPVMATFYCLPKVHKGINPLKGRPIVAGINSMTQNLGLYIDQVLRPFVLSLNSYVRDTTDFLRRLDGICIESDMILCSIDVESLYSSIPHDIGLRAVSDYLQTRGCQYSRHNEFVLKALQFCLTNNVFLFDGKYFHQLRGTAMGSPCAPTYANLLLGWWEEKIVFNDTSNSLEDKVLIWLRYIDDVFVIWRGDEVGFHKFVEGLNVNDLGLHFTCETNTSKLAFLDVLVQKSDDGTVGTENYRKPTATNALLRWESNHPRPLKRGIPKGQYLRLRRNCSDISNFKEQADDLRRRFLERGYPDHVLNEAYKSSLTKERRDLLVQKTLKSEEGTTRFITRFSNGAEEIRKILQKHWQILCMDPDIKESIHIAPQLTFRRGRSIKDRLVHSHYQDTLAKNFTACTSTEHVNSSDLVVENDERALEWATPLWERGDHVVQSAPLFLSTLKQVVLGPQVTHDTALQLLALTQGESLVSHFAVQFRTLASELNWSDKALIPIFWRGLADHVKDALATREVPATLEELITVSTRIDLRFNERRLERAQCRQRFRLAPTFAKPLESPVLVPESHEAREVSQVGSKSPTACALKVCHVCCHDPNGRGSQKDKHKKQNKL
ncbi:unnamed protein product [Ranitomeya imitator]|uniref:Reverse transcriptase domain-containing protein n=1 Tax=Ranitomeya imitator TaxID=111125 RepID=A0ABN9LMJ9_9NEOB|nr:unnamed protein product [Ranitomeya imitator]